MPLDRSDIFLVYGALRSGTTVFRLMLNAHPAMSNPGELDFLFDHLVADGAHPTGWRYDKDALCAGRIFRAQKLDLPAGKDGLDLLGDFLDQLQARAPGKVLSLNIHRHIDIALQVLPGARVIHMLRDPRDVARSSIGMGWSGTLYHGVYHWIATERAWDRIAAGIDAAQVLQISYEELFTEIEPTLRKVCAFMGRAYDPAMLRYHENTTYGPPDPALTNQWRRKSTEREVMDVEFRAGALMQSRGYAPQFPQAHVSAGRRLALDVADKMRIWTFGTRRYGLITYWAEKVTRWARLGALHRVVKQRMDHIAVQHLK